MNQQDVRNRVEQFLALMRQEQELKLELLSLDLCVATKAQAKKSLARQRAIVGAIYELRRQKMLPIVEQLAAFVGRSLGAAPSQVQR